jgi:hypothetical protein
VSSGDTDERKRISTYKTLEVFYSERRHFSSWQGNQGGCAEAYVCTPHKKPRRLTQQGRKRTLSERRRAKGTSFISQKGFHKGYIATGLHEARRAFQTVFTEKNHVRRIFLFLGAIDLVCGKFFGVHHASRYDSFFKVGLGFRSSTKRFQVNWPLK